MGWKWLKFHQGLSPTQQKGFSPQKEHGERPPCVTAKGACVVCRLWLLSRSFWLNVALSLCFFFSSKVGLNVLVQRANKFTPATRLLIQRFVPFPAVGKKRCLFSVFTSPYASTKHQNVSWAPASPLCPFWDGRDAAEPQENSAQRWCGSLQSPIRLHFPLPGS